MNCIIKLYLDFFIDKCEAITKINEMNDEEIYRSSNLFCFYFSVNILNYKYMLIKCLQTVLFSYPKSEIDMLWHK